MSNKIYTLIDEWVEHSGIKYEKGDKIIISSSQAIKFAEDGLIAKPKKKYNKTKKTVVEDKIEEKD
tara:strand:- start:2775 stop:2972 length:198 start_codon:yes stop_codon:yes gene_type:complete